MPNGLIGIIRGAGIAALYALLVYLGDITHLQALSPQWSGIISIIALGLEHMLSPKGTAVFGAVVRK